MDLVTSGVTPRFALNSCDVVRRHTKTHLGARKARDTTTGWRVSAKPTDPDVRGHVAQSAKLRPVDQSDTPTGTTSAGHAPWMKVVRSGLRQVTDLLLPPLCLSCRTPLADHAQLCGACWSEIDFIRPPLCEHLGIPMPFDPGGPILSAAATARPPNYDAARGVAHYDGTMRRLIHVLKYKDRQDALPLFSEWLQQIAAPMVGPRTVLVPVPLSRMRLLSRRYNQAALLANALGKALPAPVRLTALRRVKRTRTQVGLSPDERRVNVQGAFHVPERRRLAIEGYDVMLIDDLITSGATIEACTRALKSAGAQRVDVIALARVVQSVRPTV